MEYVGAESAALVVLMRINIPQTFYLALLLDEIKFFGVEGQLLEYTQQFHVTCCSIFGIDSLKEIFISSYSLSYCNAFLFRIIYSTTENIANLFS